MLAVEQRELVEQAGQTALSVVVLVTWMQSGSERMRKDMLHAKSGCSRNNSG